MHADRRPVILIGGVARTGKSRLAGKLAVHTGFDVIHTDQFRESFWSIADKQRRASERLRHYEEAMSSRRSGLIIEGDDLIFRNRGDTALAKLGMISNDNTLDLRLLKHLGGRPGARAFVVGCVEANSESVFAAIRRNETEICFTRTLSDDALTGFIRWSVQRSKQLKLMAAEERISYLELGREDFDSAIEETAVGILHELSK